MVFPLPTKKRTKPKKHVKEHAKKHAQHEEHVQELVQPEEHEHAHFRDKIDTMHVVHQSCRESAPFRVDFDTMHEVHQSHSKITRLNGVITQWMAGSLFFRWLNAVMGWIAKLGRDSFILGLFIEDDTPQLASLRKSKFVGLANGVLNGIPKPIRLPARWPSSLARLLSGSWLVRSLTDRLDTPIPPPVSNTGIGTVIGWGAYALPIWALLVVVMATPVLPTMILAGLLLPAFLFALFSRRFVLDGTAVFLLIFIGISIIAGVMSVVPASSMPIAVLTSVLMLSTLIVTACCKSRQSVDLFLMGFVAASAVAGVVGVYHVVTDHSSAVWLDIVLFTDIGLRLYSTFENPNVYGTYLLLAIPLAAACVVYVKSAFLKLCAFGITGMLVLNLLATYSRGCYVALALSVVMFVLIINKQLVVLIIPAMVASLFVLPASVINRLFSIVNLADTSTTFRMNIWRGSLRMLGDFWPVGVGQGEYAFNRVYHFYSLGATFTPHSHNLFLQIFIETGIVGFLVFIGVLACFYRAQANFLKRTQEFRLRVMSAAMVAAVTGFLIQGMFDYAFYNYRVMLTFYLFLGLGIAFTRVAGNTALSCGEVETARVVRESEWVTGYHD